MKNIVIILISMFLLCSNNFTHTMLSVLTNKRSYLANNNRLPKKTRNIKNTKERLLLKYAKQLNKQKVKNLLQQKNINIDFQDKKTGYTALLLTALQPFLRNIHPIDAYDMLEQVQILIEHGARADIQDENGNNALYYITLAKEDVFRLRDEEPNGCNEWKSHYLPYVKIEQELEMVLEKEELEKSLEKRLC